MWASFACVTHCFAQHSDISFVYVCSQDTLMLDLETQTVSQLSGVFLEKTKDLHFLRHTLSKQFILDHTTQYHLFEVLFSDSSESFVVLESQQTSRQNVLETSWKLCLWKDGAVTQELRHEHLSFGDQSQLSPVGWSGCGNFVYCKSFTPEKIERFEYFVWDLSSNTLSVVPLEDGLSWTFDSSLGTFWALRQKDELVIFEPAQNILDVFKIHCSSGKVSILGLRNGALKKKPTHPFLLKKSGDGFNCEQDENQPELRLPFKEGVSVCVTRIGPDDQILCDNACAYISDFCSPAIPCEGHSINAIDFSVAVSPVSNKDVVAVAPGYVIRAFSGCPQQGMGQGYGFGHHVIIRHSDDPDDVDAPKTLYAHLDEVFVCEGQYVQSGCKIGVMGNTQAIDCDSDGILDCGCGGVSNAHLHFEYHVNSVNLFGTQTVVMPFFSDVDCLLQPNHSYMPGPIEEGVYCGNNMPNMNYDWSFNDLCGSNPTITLTMTEPCETCEMAWYVFGNAYPTIEIEIPLIAGVTTTESTVNPGVFYLNTVSLMMVSSCMSTVSSAQVYYFITNQEDICLFGCTDSLACNFSEEANTDDGSCEYICSTTCQSADINMDGVVNSFDMVLFFQNLNSLVYAFTSGDMNGDGIVTFADFLQMLSFFGQTCDW
jgi:hypothetical protein